MKKLLLMLVLMLTFTGCVPETEYEKGLRAYRFGNYKTALNLLKPLAEAGHADAQFQLGWMYHNGEGVVQDDKEAVKWYRMTAEQGIAIAQNNLGAMYANGEGVQYDFNKAHMWYNIARSNGDDLASENIEKLSRYMSQSDIAEAQEMARKCVDSGYQDC